MRTNRNCSYCEEFQLMYFIFTFINLMRVSFPISSRIDILGISFLLYKILEWYNKHYSRQQIFLMLKTWRVENILPRYYYYRVRVI